MPAAPLSVAFLAGVTGGVSVAVPADGAAAAVWLGWVLSAACYSCRFVPGFVLTAVLTTVACGWSLANVATHAAMFPQLRAAIRDVRGPDAVSDVASDPVMLSGVLTGDVTAEAESARLDVAVTRIAMDGRDIPATGRVWLTVSGVVSSEHTRAWLKGRHIRAPALLRRPARYLNAGVPDHERALLRRGVALVGTVKSALLVDVVRHGGWLDERASALRAAARAAIERDVGRHDPRSAAIVRAILIGDRAGLDDVTQERLQAAGTYHVLAISGGNIAILVGLMLGVLRILALRPPVAQAVAAVGIVAYAWLVGGGASVYRATLMAVMMLAAYAVDHRGRPLNALAVAWACGLCVDPLTIADPGTWLTYGATFAIVVAAMRVGRRLLSWPWLWRACAALFVASLAAELALFPVSAFVFSRVTAAGLALNFAAIPLMTIVQVGGMVTVALAFVGAGPGEVAGWVTHAAAWGLVESGRLVDVAPWLAMRLPAPGGWAMGAYYGAWVVALGVPLLPLSASGRGSWPRRVRMAAAAAGVAGAIWILAAPNTRGAPRGFEVTILDVGQGDATLVRSHTGQSLLIDAGGAGGSSFDVGRRVVVPAVWAAGVRRLDYLLVTHGDADHMNGAEAVVRDLRPREVWEGVPVPPHEPLIALRRAAMEVGATWRTVQRGDRVWMGDVEIVAWHPPVADWERQRVRNDDSVVTEVRLGAVSIVLPGDIERSAELAVAGLLPASPLRILLAPHHGSATSSNEEFLRAAGPVLGVISVGRSNPYGHPHAAALRRFQSAGTPIVRTDRHGAVTLASDGREVLVRTFTGLKARLRVRRTAP